VADAEDGEERENVKEDVDKDAGYVRQKEESERLRG